MRRKKVWRYYCDFCGKGGCGAGAMTKHEKRCTMNPNRKCGFHDEYIQEPQVSLDELRAILRNADVHSLEAEETLLNELLDAAHGCPACVLAAIRQENATRELGDGIRISGFDYHEEVKRVFSEANERSYQEAQNEACYA